MNRHHLPCSPKVFRVVGWATTIPGSMLGQEVIFVVFAEGARGKDALYRPTWSCKLGFKNKIEKEKGSFNHVCLLRSHTWEIHYQFNLKVSKSPIHIFNAQLKMTDQKSREKHTSRYQCRCAVGWQETLTSRVIESAEGLSRTSKCT